MLQEHEQRISALESIIGKSKKPKIEKNKKTLSDHIIGLRDNGFFPLPKSAEEIHKKISTNYACELNRVEVALFRLAEKRQLRKTSKIVNGKKHKAYVW